MIRINLLPVREERRRATRRQHGMLLLAFGVAGVVVCLAMEFAVAAQISGERARIAEAQAEKRRLQTTLDEVGRYRAEEDEIRRKLGVIERLERGRTGPVRIMDEIATRMPERVWLTSLNMRGGVLELEGLSLDNEIVAAFMTGLEESDYLKNVELRETRLTEASGLKLNSFRITCRRTTPRTGGSAETASAGSRKKL